MTSSNKLIIVEGLTGSGKSIMAHFIGRQLQAHGIPAAWVHEGELDHPVPVAEPEPDTASFQETMLERWRTFTSQAQASDTVTVIEASFFNNLFETLFTENVPQPQILSFAGQIQAIIRPLKPALLYLTQTDVARALEQNFSNRGERFQQFVIEYATRTPYAQRNELTGYQGMVQFWQEFVNLTDALYQQFEGDKLVVDNSAGEWQRYNQQVLSFLSIPWTPAPRISASKATRYVGTYQDRTRGNQYQVKYQNSKLFINQLISQAWTRLIPLDVDIFAAEGWHFELGFEPEPSGRGMKLRIGGRDIDYLKLAGTVAIKETNNNPN